MAKLTNKQHEQLRSILASLNKAREYIKDKDLHVIRNSKIAALKEHEWTNGSSLRAIEIDKQSGSQLVYFSLATDLLSAFMEAN